MELIMSVNVFYPIQTEISQWTKSIIMDSRFAPSQWETSLQSNVVSRRLGANLESALWRTSTQPLHCSGNVAIFMKRLALAALELIKMATSSVASDENFVKATFPFQSFLALCCNTWYYLMISSTCAVQIYFARL